jgi:hypothetical protein
MRTSITYRDAEAYVSLIKERFVSWVNAGYGDPMIIEDWDGEGHFGICWDGPYCWTYYAGSGSFEYEEREPEFGFKLPVVSVPKRLDHVFAEPYDGGVLVLYMA